MADSDTAKPQQVTSQTPAAGKAIAERTRLAREAQKRLLAVTNAFLIMAKHVDFSDDKKPSRDSLAGQDKEDNAQQFLNITR